MRVRVIDTTFSPEAELHAFMANAPHCGACASFVGLVREDASATLTALELQHYPGFTDREIERCVQDTMARHAIEDMLVIHRVGRLQVGEPIVLAAALSHHRASAFAAVEEIMDRLKTDAPFWKREWRGDNAVWIEPTREDEARRARHKETR